MNIRQLLSVLDQPLGSKPIAPHKRNSAPNRGFKKGSLVLLALAASAISFGQVGTWTKVATDAPENLETALILTNGKVFIRSIDNLQNYWVLTPDSNFSYVNGTWSLAANSIYGVLYGPTEVMRDGRVFIAGGEYEQNTPDQDTAQIYDPSTNSWSVCPDALYTDIADTGSALLADGSIICSTRYGPNTDIYSPASNQWTQTGSMNQDTGDEESWMTLPDGSVLSVYFSSQRYIPSQHQWIYTAPLPTNLIDQYYEMGPLVQLYNGQAMAFGSGVGTGATVIYTPPSTLLGTDDFWTLGPAIPNNYGCPDCAACVESNGKVLFMSTPQWLGAAYIVEYDPVAQSMTPVPLPDNNYYRSDLIRMVALPSGQVLMTGFKHEVWIYTPTSGPNSSWQANLTSYVPASDGSYTLNGTQLNGLSRGGAYGDECTPDSAYPIVFLQNTTSGAYYFARSYNHSTTLQATGNTPVSTHFQLPAGLPTGTYNLMTSASGVWSANSLPFGYGLKMPPSQQLAATPNGSVSYNVPVVDYFTPARTVTPTVKSGPSWVQWDGTTLTASPPPTTRTGNYPVVLSAVDNGTPAASGTSQLMIRVAPVALQSAKFSAASVTELNTVQLNIVLTQPAPLGGTTVKIARKLGALTGPSSVVIPEGSSTASVTFTAGATTDPQIADFTVSYGTSSFTVTIRITP